MPRKPNLTAIRLFAETPHRNFAILPHRRRFNDFRLRWILLSLSHHAITNFPLAPMWVLMHTLFPTCCTFTTYSVTLDEFQKYRTHLANSYGQRRFPSEFARSKDVRMTNWSATRRGAMIVIVAVFGARTRALSALYCFDSTVTRRLLTHCSTMFAGNRALV